MADRLSLARCHSTMEIVGLAEGPTEYLSCVVLLSVVLGCSSFPRLSYNIRRIQPLIVRFLLVPLSPIRWTPRRSRSSLWQRSMLRCRRILRLCAPTLAKMLLTLLPLRNRRSRSRGGTPSRSQVQPYRSSWLLYSPLPLVWPCQLKLMRCPRRLESSSPSLVTSGCVPSRLSVSSKW